MIASAAAPAEKADESGWEVLGKLLTFLLLIVLSTLYFAVVIRQLWAWFIVPAFHMAPLSLVTAAGIDTLVSVLRPPPESATEKDEDLGDLLKRGLKRVATYPTICLLTGWAIHLFA